MYVPNLTIHISLRLAFFVIEKPVWKILQLPDLVTSGTTTRATFYRETHDFPGASKENKNPRNFLAVYQTDFEESLETKNFKEKVRPGSDLFPKKFATGENGDFDVRNYKLLVDYDPKKIGEGEMNKSRKF